MTTMKPAVDHFRVGLLFAVASAFAFGLSGPLAKSLMESGWTPTAAVTARLAGGAVVMAVFATIVRPNWFREALQHRKTVVAYGLIPIAGAQLCYFNAVSHLSVGVALLLEYTAPVLVVAWLWATTRRRPSNLTLTGVVDRHRRNHVGAGRLLRRPHQSRRHRLGVGRGDLRGLLLHDVGQSDRRRHQGA